MNSEGGLDKLKCRIVVRGDMPNKHGASIEDKYSPSAPLRVLKMFLADTARHKYRIHQFDVVGAFIQAKMRSIVYIKITKLYGEIFPEYQAYCGRQVRLKKAMYDITL
jgi:hypothetical protein